MITELRIYTIKRGMMPAWLAAWNDAAQRNLASGIRVELAAYDPESMGTFVWLRSFRDEEDRQRREQALYGSDWWREVGDAVMANVVTWEARVLTTVAVRDDHGSLVSVSEGSAPDDLFPPDGT